MRPLRRCVSTRHRAAAALMIMALTAPSLTVVAQRSAPRTFARPEEAVRALIAGASAGSLDELRAIFGSDGEELIASSDPASARWNRDVFIVAAAEGWRLRDQGTGRKTLIVGNEDWPFPVPLVKKANRWRFDSAAGKEEVLARRIGRNELAVIATCRAYVAAQRRYAQQPHDGKPAGLFATTFRSDAGRQNGLYWPASQGPSVDGMSEAKIACAPPVRQVPRRSGLEQRFLCGFVGLCQLRLLCNACSNAALRRLTNHRRFVNP
jgi:hypothetical protein